MKELPGSTKLLAEYYWQQPSPESKWLLRSRFAAKQSPSLITGSDFSFIPFLPFWCLFPCSAELRVAHNSGITTIMGSVTPGTSQAENAQKLLAVRAGISNWTQLTCSADTNKLSYTHLLKPFLDPHFSSSCYFSEVFSTGGIRGVAVQ